MNPHAKQHGFVMVTMLLSATVLIACVGLAIDTGYLQTLKLRMQTAADAAALGGVQEMRMNGAANVPAAGKGDAALNGFTDGVNGVAVTVKQPPVSGYYAGSATAVEAIITQNAGTFFMRLLGFSSISVSARSVAQETSSSTCVYVLDPSSEDAFSVTNGVGVNVSCGLAVDSASSTALTASGGAQLTASSISVAGNYSMSNGSKVSPLPAIHAVPLSDPLSYVAAPSVGACAQNNYSVGGSTVSTLSPGVYCGGITIGNAAGVTLNPGTYILVGGGLNLGGSASVTGAGVTFYNTYDGTHAYAPINIGNGVAVTLSAPTTGPLAGILMFQDRTVAGGVGALLGGGAHLSLTGALYFPTTSLSYSNGVSAPYTILVAKTISFAGGVKINSDYTSLPGGSPAKSAALSE